jgi:hypothetical protein
MRGLTEEAVWADAVGLNTKGPTPSWSLGNVRILLANRRTDAAVIFVLAHCLYLSGVVAQLFGNVVT